MSNPENNNDEILSHWQIQESLLQSYRGFFLTSQSIIFAFASFGVNNSNGDYRVFFVLMVLGLFLLKYWCYIGNRRGLDVSYFQMLLLQTEDGDSMDKIMTSFKSW
jgi:hypothetical protein